jgi:hypothetical protein
MPNRKETFTSLLLNEIRRHLESLATDPRFTHEQQDALYAAVRDVGRNTRRIVAEANRKLSWNMAIVEHNEVTDGR